jgi:hypothetical protein
MAKSLPKVLVDVLMAFLKINFRLDAYVNDYNQKKPTYLRNICSSLQV